MKAAFAQFLSLRHGGNRVSLLHSAPARAAVPFAELPRHQLHGDAPGHPAAAVPRTPRQRCPYPARPTRVTRVSGTPTSTRRAPASIGPTALPIRLCHAAFTALTSGSLRARSPCRRRSRRGGCSRFPTPTRTASPPRTRRRRPRRPRRSATPATPATRSSTWYMLTGALASVPGRRAATTTSTTATRTSSGRVMSGAYRPTGGYPTDRHLPGREQRHESRLQPAPVLAVGDDAEGDEPDHGADAPVRGLDHDRVLRGQAGGRPVMANANPGTSLATLGFDLLGPEIGDARPARRPGTGASSSSTASSSTASTTRPPAASARPSSTARTSSNDADSSQQSVSRNEGEGGCQWSVSRNEGHMEECNQQLATRRSSGPTFLSSVAPAGGSGQQSRSFPLDSTSPGADAARL